MFKLKKKTNIFKYIAFIILVINSDAKFRSLKWRVSVSVSFKMSRGRNLQEKKMSPTRIS